MYPAQKALVCLMLSVVNADKTKAEDSTTKDAEDNYETTTELTTTIKLPLFIRLFGKKPLKFIKKSISKILGKNFTRRHSNRTHSTLKAPKTQQTEPTVSIFNTAEVNFTTPVEKYNEADSTSERQTFKTGSWSRKSYPKDMSYYNRFVYTPERFYLTPVRVRKYYTLEGSPYTTQETTSQRTTKFDTSRTTSKVNSNTGDIRIFTTTVPIEGSRFKSRISEQVTSTLSDRDSEGVKRQRRSSVDDASESEQGYTYLLRKKRPQSTFNPYAYLTRLSKKPVFTGDFTPRRYTYSIAAATTSTTKSAFTTKPKTFVRTVPKVATTSTTPRPFFRTMFRPRTRKFYTTMSQAPITTSQATDTAQSSTTTSSVAAEGSKEAKKKTTLTTRPQHFWVNNWNLRYMSYYMHPRDHTYRKYEPETTTYNPNPQIKTTRAMYYLSQYWNTAYFSYYTNFDPSDESFHGFAKRLGYFPDATTRFKKIRMMPKRYRPEGFIDVFSLDSFVRDINKRLAENQTYPPPHERDSISSSVEDVSYWFFFNNSVTIDQLNPGTRWKSKPRPTFKPMPSYFFKDSILTRYYPPSREEDLPKVHPTWPKVRKIHSTRKPITRSSSIILKTTTTPSTTVQTSTARLSPKLPHVRTYGLRMRTPIPTLPTNKEITPRNIDPYGLLNKIIQYNVQIKRPLPRDQDLLHPVNQLPRFLKLPITLSPNMMMYTDYRGKQLFTLLGKYHIHEDNKTLECVRNPTEFLNPFKVVAPPPQSGYYRIIQRHRIRDNAEIEKNPAKSHDGVADSKGRRKLHPNDRTVAVEIRFYPLKTTGTIKTWNEYLGSKKNKSSLVALPTTRSSSTLTRRRIIKGSSLPRKIGYLCDLET